MSEIIERGNTLLTIDLCDVSTTLHSDSDVHSSKTLLTKQEHWLQKLTKRITY